MSLPPLSPIGKPGRPPAGDVLLGHYGCQVSDRVVSVSWRRDGPRSKPPARAQVTWPHLVLGLIFLKYISDSFERRRREFEAAMADPEQELFTESCPATPTLRKSRPSAPNPDGRSSDCDCPGARRSPSFGGARNR